MEGRLTGTTRVAGVIAWPVYHSLSPAMHNAGFRALGLNCIYVPFNVHPEEVEAAVAGIRALGLMGVNITIPHKESVMEFLDWVSDEALRIRSVNTIHNDEGVLKGYSTDGQGFIRALEAAGKSPEGSNAVILGAGGSARATVYALVSSGARVTVANRTFSRARELSELLNSALETDSVRPVGLDSVEARDAVWNADLLVNCTSVGMHPHTDSQPIPSEWLHPGLFVYDQIYNPSKTRLLEAAEIVGAEWANGIGMLVYQGAISFEMWTGYEAPVEVMKDAVLASVGNTMVDPDAEIRS